MAKGVPSGYTRFLERLLAELPNLSKRQPEVADRLAGARMLSTDYQVSIPHPMLSTLRWSFRQNKKTKSRESKTFNVEFTPKRSYDLSPATVERAWRESGLQGEVGFEGREFFFQIAWGYGDQADGLVYDEHLAANLRNWAIDAIAVPIRLVEGLATEVGVKAQPATVARMAGQSPVHRRRLSLTEERLLEDLIVEYWADLDFGADLEYVGRQIRCGEIGVLDILARDRTTDGFVVIELKRDQGDDETFGQLSRYMGWIAENKDQPEGAPVRGIIVAAQITPKLEAAAKTNPNVRLVEYAIKIELLHKEEAE